MTRVGVITQARMTSTRLPGKVLLRAGGATMLQHHVNRLSRAGLDVYVATTTNETDQPIMNEAGRLGANQFRGSEKDVLSRFAGAAREFELDVVVRVTSDCPLIDGELVQAGVKRFIEIDSERAYVSNALDRTYPRGFDFEVFSASALYQADERATRPFEREHVTPFLYLNQEKMMTMHSIRREIDASRYRVTLDTAVDFDVIARLLEDHNAADLTVDEIISVLDTHPSLAQLNLQVAQKTLGE